MFYCLSSLIATSTVRPLLIAAIILATGPSTDASEEFIPSSAFNLLAMEKYYDIENLADAAATLRQDAVRFGLDVNEHPLANKASQPYSVLNLPVVQITPNFSDTSFLSALAKKSALPGETDNSVAILAVKRALSIDEVASLFESGIRILEKLFAGPKWEVFGGYIVQGPAADLAGLRDRDYFSWLGEYRTDFKWQSDLGASSLDAYSITFFKRQTDDFYLADLKTLQATVTYQSKRFRGISVQCSWDTAQQVMKLDWVRSIFPIEPAIDETSGKGDSF